MYKRSILLFFVPAIAFLIAACTDPGAGTGALEELTSPPQAPPEAGYYAHIEVYTIDEITPSGEITLEVIKESTGEREAFSMTSKSSGISGTTIHEAWLRIRAEPRTEEYKLSYINSRGERALGLFQTPEGRCRFYRDISGENIIDGDLKINYYSELIRHWESSTPNSSMEISVDGFLDDDGNQVQDVYWHYTLYHELNEDYIMGIGYYSTLDTGSNTITFDKIRTLPDESELPQQDRLFMGFVKEFYYTQDYPMINFDDLADMDLGEIPMWRNKIVSFDYVYSRDAVFSGTEPVKKGKISFISSWDFFDWEVADAFYESFADPALSSRLVSYDLDGDSFEDIKLELEIKDGVDNANLLDSNWELYSYGTGTLPLAVDFNTLASESGYTDFTAGTVYGAETTRGGYALIEITDFHVMTTAEIAAITAGRRASKSFTRERTVSRQGRLKLSENNR